METPVSALLLAAGSSSRMGQIKQLLKLGDKTVIRRCSDALVGGGVNEIVVVIAACRGGLAPHLRGLPVSIAVNETPYSDMAESVRIGLKQIRHYTSSVLVCLSDNPLVSAETVRSILREHQAFPGKIIVPEYDGRRGHPSLFPRNILDEIFTGVTLRDIVRKDPSRVRPVTVGDEGVVLDMDTREDYEMILNRFQKNVR
ncbi:MAG TPA: nucleotidyltransferase family protein [Nitrospirota bacterium]|nr:nucleotidyltransferase family protein [Nitrospirota bacterium]